MHTILAASLSSLYLLYIISFSLTCKMELENLVFDNVTDNEFLIMWITYLVIKFCSLHRPIINIQIELLNLC